MEAFDKLAPRTVFLYKAEIQQFSHATNQVMPVERCCRLDYFSPLCLCFSPQPLSHTMLTAQSLAQRLARPSCSWTQAHLTAWDPRFAPAKNSFRLMVSVADPSGMENPEVSGSTLIFCQERQGGPAKCVSSYRHVPSSAVVQILSSGQDRAGFKEAAVMEQRCRCPGGDDCSDRWKRRKHIFQISSLSTSFLFFIFISEHYPLTFQLQSIQN